MFSLSWDYTYIDQSFILSVWVWVFKLGSHLYRSVIVLLVWVCVFWVVLISISHLPINLCSVWVGTAPISIDHRLVSLSLHFLGRTNINRPSSYHFVFNLSWDHTYIDQSFISLVQLEFGVAPISIGHLLVSLCSVRVETAPISICYLHVSSVWVLRLHLYQSVIFLSVQFSLSFRERTYIYRSFILSWQFCLSFEAAPISIGHLLISSVQFEFSEPHLYRSVIHHVLSIVLEFLGLHLYRLVICLISLSSVWVSRTAPISIGHSSCQLSWVLFGFESRLPSWVYSALSHTLSFLWVLFPCVDHFLSQSSLYCSLYHGPVLFIAYTLIASSTFLARVSPF